MKRKYNFDDYDDVADTPISTQSFVIIAIVIIAIVVTVLLYLFK